jgi:5'-methylthioadenosine phosphorylase
MLAIIGGSGLCTLQDLTNAREQVVSTPYGAPSCALCFGRLNRAEVVFLARHGNGHSIPPHAINYRANIWALASAGVKEIVAVASVGGIHADCSPGVLVVPSQIIDYTHGRHATYFDGGEGAVRHIDFTHPYCPHLRRKLLEACARANEMAVDGGTYAVTQGPRLETAAEIDRLERDGAHVVGMTGMPEAALARESGVAYAALTVVVNWAAGRATSAASVDFTSMGTILEVAMMRVRRILGTIEVDDGR